MLSPFEKKVDPSDLGLRLFSSKMGTSVRNASIFTKFEVSHVLPSFWAYGLERDGQSDRQTDGRTAQFRNAASSRKCRIIILLFAIDIS